MKVLQETDFKSYDGLADRIRSLPPNQRAQAMADVKEERARCLAAKTVLEEQHAEFERLEEWAKKKDFVLEPNDCSRLHQLQEAIQLRHISQGDTQPVNLDVNAAVLRLAHSFVVKHDWAAAFAGATDFDGGDVRFPYDSCAFEFRINGRTIIAANVSDERGVFCGGFVQAGKAWCCGGSEMLQDDVFVYAMKQVRAICIALDAEIATHEIVRAPTKLNAARAKLGRLPLYDYHVVSLAGRHKKPDFDGGGTHKSPRLHFRRGHWRHYNAHKSWIRWTLVGNPSLGYIDKHYKLS